MLLAVSIETQQKDKENEGRRVAIHSLKIVTYAENIWVSMDSQFTILLNGVV